MPPLGTGYAEVADGSLAAAAAVEMARLAVPADSVARKALNSTRMHYVYEAAFLKTFAAWETLLEEATLRYMCGYSAVLYPNPAFPANITRATSLAQARQRLFGNYPFLLWHDPTRNANRVSGWVQGCPVEVVATTAQQWLEWVAAVRHRIAHRSDDARHKFDNATMGLAGVRIPGASAGRFLRSEAPSGRRWIVELTGGMKGLAIQVAP
jgi:hypothetical protein